MTSWRADDGAEPQDQFLNAIYHSLNESFQKLGEPGIRLISLTSRDGFQPNYDDVVVDLVLPGNIPMTVDCWSDLEAELGLNIVEGFEANVEAATSMVMDFVQDCQKYGFDRIVGVFDGADQYARSCSAQSQRTEAGTFVLQSLKLAFRPFWRRSGPLIFEAEFSSFDEWLRPGIDTSIDIYSPSKLKDVLRDASETFAKKAAAKARLKRNGATCEIDLFAVNLLTRGGDLSSQFKGLERPCTWGGKIWVDCGRVCARASIGDNHRMEIRGNEIRIYGYELPEVALLNTIGMPITKIVDCPLFSQEMVIVRAQNEALGASPTAVFEIQQPRFFYDDLSGYYWRQDAI